MRRLLTQAELDGWLLYDFRGGNPLAAALLGIPPDAHLTRRYFFWVPRAGQPTLLANGIETGNWRALLGAIPGGETARIRAYSGHLDLQAALGEILKPGQRIAMEYSPSAAVPFVSRVDGGTLEQVRGFGVEVVTSGDLLQQFLRLSSDELDAHREAAACLLAAKDAGFRLVHERLQRGETVDELSVQGAVMGVIAEWGMVTDHSAIVGFGAHAADPHYSPSAAQNARLLPGQCVLIDLWAQKRPDLPFADITWMGCAGEPDEGLLEVWSAVRDARDAAVDLITTQGYETLQGWQADRTARDLLTERGYGEAFLHRLGHNIYFTGHGPGVNLDDFETHDTRRLLEGLLCSVEPGVYLPERGIGVRSEVNLYFAPGGRLEVTTTPQRQLLVLGRPGVTYADALAAAI
ncbi:MAG: aminopeptidase P family protein [Cytophagales bacterium]|nr:aminopeptidase P family protein [Armatimonadota bacterium]